MHGRLTARRKLTDPRPVPHRARPGASPESLAEHERIVSAVAAGDREAAERAMREHLSNVAAVLVGPVPGERTAGSQPGRGGESLAPNVS